MENGKKESGARALEGSKMDWEKCPVFICFQIGGGKPVRQVTPVYLRHTLPGHTYIPPFLLFIDIILLGHMVVVRET